MPWMIPKWTPALPKEPNNVYGTSRYWEKFENNLEKGVDTAGEDKV